MIFLYCNIIYIINNFYCSTLSAAERKKYEEILKRLESINIKCSDKEKQTKEAKDLNASKSILSSEASFLETLEAIFNFISCPTKEERITLLDKEYFKKLIFDLTKLENLKKKVDVYKFKLNELELRIKIMKNNKQTSEEILEFYTNECAELLNEICFVENVIDQLKKIYKVFINHRIIHYAEHLEETIDDLYAKLFNTNNTDFETFINLFVLHNNIKEKLLELKDYIN